ncbi:MAG TPA: Dabb family protein [Tepidisphaeraceae bacterium]|nr:Dabb family protein [Tepidisphaeraceae bacterium]
MKTKCLVFLLAAALCVSCQRAHVTHVVVCWLKNPGDEQARQQLIDDGKSFTKIPGIVHVSAGRVLPSTRPAVDSSFDVAIVMKFKDEAALKSYGQHPVHLAAVERTLKPLVAKYVIYDYSE